MVLFEIQIAGISTSSAARNTGSGLVMNETIGLPCLIVSILNCSCSPALQASDIPSPTWTCQGKNLGVPTCRLDALLLSYGSSLQASIKKCQA